MSNKLLKTEQALGVYLDEMLQQATGDDSARPTRLQTKKLLLPAELPVAVALEESLRQTDLAAETTLDTQLSDAGTTKSRRPELPLQCLMFKLGEHRLSIPLMQLASVIEWRGVKARLPESPAWMLGLIEHREQKIPVVDSYLLLNIGVDDASEPKHLLVLGEGQWAITCDDLEQIVNLDYEDIQWQQGNSKPLVLGTIRDTLSTLLDPGGIAAALNSGGPPVFADGSTSAEINR